MNRSGDTLVLDHVTAREGKSVCEDISFSVPAGSIHLLLGDEGSGKEAIVACVLGERRPSSGRVWISGRDAWADRRLLSGLVEDVTPGIRVRRSASVRWLSKRRSKQHEKWDEQGLNQRLARFGVPSEQPWQELASSQRTAALVALALAGSPHLLVLHGANFRTSGPAADAWIPELREAASGGACVLIVTDRADDVEELADGISILQSGRILVSDGVDALKSRFRKIRYRNEITLERKEYGNELDDFDAAQVRVRGWGVEAVVSNFSDFLYEQFRRTPGVVDAQAIPMSLAEIFETLARPRRVAPPP